MAKHESVAIRGDDLLGRLTGGADEVVEVAEITPDSWWIVTWPEHVLTPKFNGDADYRRCGSESEAREDADCVYGER